MSKKQYITTGYERQNNKNKFIMVLTMLLVVLFSGYGTVNGQCETADREDIRICDESKNCFTLMDRNLGATTNDTSKPEFWGCTYQRGNNTGFPIGCEHNECSDEITENNLTTTLSIWNNKYNDNGYNGEKFIIKNKDYRSDKSHDGLRGGINDNEENDRGEILSTYDDVYDVDIFRQGPCPQGYHVPSLGERKHVLKIIDNDFNKINLADISSFRDYNNGIIYIGEGSNYWTSSPISNTEKSNAITEKGDIKEVDRSMGLHIRCFKNKRDAMVGVSDGITDTVFFDTQVPSINKIKEDDTVLLNYTGDTALFKQQVKISESIKTGTDISYLFLQACQDLRNSYLSLSGINTDLEINCILEYNMFKPWGQNVLNIYVIGVADNTKKTINSCSMLSTTDAGNTINLNIEQNFVQDFSVNKSVFTNIISDFIYAPTSTVQGDSIRNYIYTGQHSLSMSVDGDTIIVTDEDLLHGRDIYILSAEPLAEDDLTCTIIEGPDGLEINPICKITKNSIQTISMGIIHSCGSIGCEDSTCKEGNKCRRNNPSKYKNIKAPFKYKNKVNISAITDNTYYLQSGDVRTIRIALKENQGCYNRQDGTNSTYVQIKFKKIISPYKAGYLSGDDGGIRYTSKNLGNAIKSGGKDIGFTWYISNPQTAKSGGYSGGNIDKINYEIKFNTGIADENYHIVGDSTIGSYNKQIIITKPTFNESNPEGYKFIFPTY